MQERVLELGGRGRRRGQCTRSRTRNRCETVLGEKRCGFIVPCSFLWILSVAILYYKSYLFRPELDVACYLTKSDAFGTSASSFSVPRHN